MSRAKSASRQTRLMSISSYSNLNASPFYNGLNYDYSATHFVEFEDVNKEINSKLLF